MKNSLAKAALICVFGALSGCLPYLYHERDPALVQGIDIDQTLKVARDELNKGGGFSVLTIWAIRDQRITAAQAHVISELYFQHIGQIDRDDTKFHKFGVWHLTWAISNLFRFGDESVKIALGQAYNDAVERVKTLDRSYAEEHVLGKKMYTGFAHAGGRAYARNHLVVPGNDEYLQSYRQYLKENK